MTSLSAFKPDTQNLAGQVTIVTGGGRGIGRAIAQALARAGMVVALVSQTASELDTTVAMIEAEQGKAIALPLNVTDRQAVQHMVDTVESQLGPVALLVNNAGLAGPLGPIGEVDVDEWWRCQEVNLRGPLLCASAILPHMISRRRGRIINIASSAGLQAIPYLSAYITSKTALIRFSENLAAETREHGIGVFAICPGLVRTEMAEYVMESAAGQKWLPDYRTGFDAGHDVPPQRAAQLVCLLAEGKADTLSGCFLDLDDHIEELVKHATEIEKDELYTLRLRKLEET